MKRLLSLALVSSFAFAGLVGCEANAKVGDDDDHGTVHKTEVKRESPNGDTTYKRTTETHTEVH
jgi:hypothetical protein